MSIERGTSNPMLWRNFLALEKSFMATFYYVDYDDANADTFSLAYRGLLIQVCSDIEYAFSCILDKEGSLKDYLKGMKDHHAGFQTIEVMIPYYHESLQPWQDAENCDKPGFWVPTMR